MKTDLYAKTRARRARPEVAVGGRCLFRRFRAPGPAAGVTLFGLLFLAAAVPLSARAEPQLQASSPGADKVSTPVTEVRLAFSEAIVPASARFALTMTAMPGMADHPPMPVKAITPMFAPDQKSVVLKLRLPLASGTYILQWSVTGKDNRAARGQFGFQVQ